VPVSVDFKVAGRLINSPMIVLGLVGLSLEVVVLNRSEFETGLPKSFFFPSGDAGSFSSRMFAADNEGTNKNPNSFEAIVLAHQPGNYKSR